MKYIYNTLQHKLRGLTVFSLDIVTYKQSRGNCWQRAWELFHNLVQCHCISVTHKLSKKNVISPSNVQYPSTYNVLETYESVLFTFSINYVFYMCFYVALVSHYHQATSQVRNTHVPIVMKYFHYERSVPNKFPYKSAVKNLRLYRLHVLSSIFTLTYVQLQAIFRVRLRKKIGPVSFCFFSTCVFC